MSRVGNELVVAYVYGARNLPALPNGSPPTAYVFVYVSYPNITFHIIRTCVFTVTVRVNKLCRKSKSQEDAGAIAGENQISGTAPTPTSDPVWNQRLLAEYPEDRAPYEGTK